jgi:hypothetical protein
MRRVLHPAGLCVLLVGCCAVVATAAEEVRRLPVEEYRDRMAAGWIGQMVGVGWGAPTEFKWKGAIIPEDKMPTWRPAMVNQFNQDDIYVEMTFLRTLEQHGFDVPIRQAGIDFANSGYRLWHANRAGRDNLRKGIAPPDSGHPAFNKHADDIDYQIEADYAGLIAPGMPNVAIELGETFGRLMNYGDGLYGGYFVGGMYAEAFFEDDPVKIVEAGLKCIPAKSQYAETVRDVLAWFAAEPGDWQATWRKIEEKYQDNTDYRRFSCNKGAFNIDAKINGAYIVMGLLYGKRDPDATILISARCGQDSDCNPSNAGGILFTTMGRRKLPERFTSALQSKNVFSHTAYSFDGLLDVCEKLVRQAVKRQGGRIERSADRTEVFVIPVVAPRPGTLETCWEPGPTVNSKYTAEEMAKIKPSAVPKPKANRSVGKSDISNAVEAVAPGWTATNCGSDMKPGLRDEWGGRKRVLVTHPLSTTVPCVLSKTVTVPAAGRSRLLIDVAHDPRGDWTLVVKANGREVTKRKIGKATVKSGWLTVETDLAEFAGKTVKLEIQNCADGWNWEAGYFSRIAVVSE